MANNLTGSWNDAFGNPIPSGGVNLFYSIHANSSTNTSATGTEIYYFDDLGDPTRALYSRRTGSMALGAYIQDTFSENSFAEWRGVFEGNFQVLRDTYMPAVLLETGFISNQQECNNMQTISYLWAAGDGITRGVLCITSDSPNGWVDYIINGDIESEDFTFGDGDCALIENTNNGNSQTYTVRFSTITIDYGSFVVVEPNVRLTPGFAGEIRCIGGDVVLAPNAEIVCGTEGGFFFLSGGNVHFQGPGSCIRVESGGEFRLAANQTLTVTENGFMIIAGGDVILENDAKIIYEAVNLPFDIQPGAIFKLGKNARIDMYGKMLAQGTANNPITFQSSYANPTTAQYWDGIYLNNGNADDNSIIEHAVIEHGQYGILAYNASPEIRNTTIRDCNLYALRLDYSTAEITNNIFENSAALAGVYMRYSDPVFSGNTIRNNNTKGLYLYQSSPDMTFNTLSQNDCYGIFCTYYSSPEMGSSSEPQNPGNNTIEGHEVGIYASNYSQPFLGDYEAMPPYAGYNRVIENNSYAVKAYANSHIAAHGNWWGSYPPSASLFYSDGTSSIDYAMALTADPNGSAPLLQTGVIAAPAGNNGLMNGNNDPRQLMKLAKKLRRAKTPRKALKIYRKLLRKYPDHPLAAVGLRELIVTYREAQLDSAVAALLEATQHHPNETVRQVAADLLTGEYLLNEDVSNAIQHAKQTVRRFPNSESEKQALFNLVHIFTFDTPDTGQAQQYLAQMQQKYPDDALTVMAATVIAGNGSAAPTVMLKQLGGQTASAERPTMPERFALHQNYPNPFNPATTLAFDLPAPSEVRLAVYDLQGRLVKTVAAGRYEAGRHSAVWDGSDDAGKPVSSGVYFYRLTVQNGAVPFVQTRKMLLLR